MSNVNFMQWNTQGLARKLDILTTILNTENINIFALNETLVKRDIVIPDYQVFQKHAEQGDARGVILGIHKSLHASEIANPHRDALSAQVQFNDKAIIVSTMYINPNKSNPNLDFITASLSSNLPSIFMGDLNCKHVNFGCLVTKKNGRALLSILNANPDFHILNNGKPTRIGHVNQRNDILDLALCNTKFLKHFTNFYVSPHLYSDHLPIVVNSNLSRPAPISRRDYRKADWSSYQDSLLAAAKSAPNPPQSIEEIEAYNAYITQAILGAEETSVPTIRSRYSANLNPSLASLISKKKTLVKAFLSTKNPWCK